MEWKPEAWVAVYAACVSTGALLVQVRNWFASGPRLRISVISDGLIVGGDPEFDERDLVIVNATNVGAADTMITNLGIEQRYPFYYFWRRSAINTFIVLNPQMLGHPVNVPQLLEPAHRWTGIVRNRPDVVANMRDGDHYVSLHVSHRTRPYLKRIRPIQRRPPASEIGRKVQG
jgi:hypothetical protein